MAHVDFETTNSIEALNHETQLHTTLLEIFLRDVTTNLLRLKPLYITIYIECLSVSKVFVDCHDEYHASFSDKGSKVVER